MNAAAEFDKALREEEVRSLRLLENAGNANRAHIKNLVAKYTPYPKVLSYQLSASKKQHEEEVERLKVSISEAEVALAKRFEAQLEHENLMRTSEGRLLLRQEAIKEEYERAYASATQRYLQERDLIRNEVRHPGLRADRYALITSAMEKALLDLLEKRDRAFADLSAGQPAGNVNLSTCPDYPHTRQLLPNHLTASPKSSALRALTN